MLHSPSPVDCRRTHWTSPNCTAAMFRSGHSTWHPSRHHVDIPRTDAQNRCRYKLPLLTLASVVSHHPVSNSLVPTVAAKFGGSNAMRQHIAGFAKYVRMLKLIGLLPTNPHTFDFQVSELADSHAVQDPPRSCAIRVALLYQCHSNTLCCAPNSKTFCNSFHVKSPLLKGTCVCNVHPWSSKRFPCVTNPPFVERCDCQDPARARREERFTCSSEPATPGVTTVLHVSICRSAASVLRCLSSAFHSKPLHNPLEASETVSNAIHHSAHHLIRLTRNVLEPPEIHLSSTHQHVVDVYHHVKRCLGAREQCGMESTSCQTPLLHSRRQVPRAKPSAHLAFQITLYADVPPCSVELPLSSSVSLMQISRNTSAYKKALANSTDIKQHASRSELPPCPKRRSSNKQIGASLARDLHSDKRALDTSLSFPISSTIVLHPVALDDGATVRCSHLSWCQLVHSKCIERLSCQVVVVTSILIILVRPRVFPVKLFNVLAR